MDEFYPRLLSCRGDRTWRYAARAGAGANMKFALDKSAFSIDTMLVHSDLKFKVVCL